MNRSGRASWENALDRLLQANDTLQMAARRIAMDWAVRDPAGLSEATADGRMGYLLYRRPRARRWAIPLIARFGFAVDGTAPDLLADLPPLLDRVDAWIGDGILGGKQPNVADLMVAPCLALVLYRSDARELFAGRPALALVDRLLPEPT